MLTQLTVPRRFTEWTPEGNVRHASFEGLRIDKAAKPITGITRHPIRPPSTRREPRANRSISSIKISNANRAIDTNSRLKKIDLVRYYDDTAAHMLTHSTVHHRLTAQARAATPRLP